MLSEAFHLKWRVVASHGVTMEPPCTSIVKVAQMMHRGCTDGAQHACVIGLCDYTCSVSVFELELTLLQKLLQASFTPSKTPGHSTCIAQ